MQRGCAALMSGVMLALALAGGHAGEAVPGPAPDTRITEQYARLVARDAFFWAWPLVNVYNRRLAFKDLPEPGLMGGIVPVP